jgi:hypothetical protein
MEAQTYGAIRGGRWGKLNMRKVAIALAVLMMATFAEAQIVHFLVAQWIENGSRMCKYDNGTVLNMGISLCPLSI